MVSAVNKSRRIVLHLSCIVVKARQGRDCTWHWQHLLREFGCGEYATRKHRPRNESQIGGQQTLLLVPASENAKPGNAPGTECSGRANSYFNLWTRLWRELGAIPASEHEEAAVMLARLRLLLHQREWRSAEVLSAQGSGLHPEEGEFTVQRAFALHQMDSDEKAEQVMQSAPDWIRRTGILHYNLACYEARLGDITTARECIDAAIQINAGIGKKSARMDPLICSRSGTESRTEGRSGAAWECGSNAAKPRGPWLGMRCRRH